MNRIERALEQLAEAHKTLEAFKRDFCGCCSRNDDRPLQATLDDITRARKLLESANRDSKVISDLTSWMED